MKLWHILEGPFETEDERGFFVGKVQLQDDSPEITHEEFYFDDFDAAYKVSRYFDYNILPLDAEGIGKIIGIEPTEKMEAYH